MIILSKANIVYKFLEANFLKNYSRIFAENYTNLRTILRRMAFDVVKALVRVKSRRTEDEIDDGRPFYRKSAPPHGGLRNSRSRLLVDAGSRNERICPNEIDVAVERDEKQLAIRRCSTTHSPALFVYSTVDN